MQILVLYSTSEGHTAKIAKVLADVFESLGNEVVLTQTSDPGYCDPGTFDAAVLCAPIHVGWYPSEFVQFIKDWKSSLSEVPTALVTSSLMSASPDEKDREKAEQFPVDLMSETGWTPGQIYNVSGSLNYPEYDVIKRWVMKRAAKSGNFPVDTDTEYDFTDWEALRAFANEFLSSIDVKAA